MVANNNQVERNFNIERQIEEQIKKQIAPLIKSGESIILDYCPWEKSRRNKYKNFIESCGGVMQIIYFNVPIKELKRRAKERNNLNNKNYQYITPKMLDDFVTRFDSPNDNELYTLA